MSFIWLSQLLSNNWNMSRKCFCPFNNINLKKKTSKTCLKYIDWNFSPVTDPIKLFFFANEEFLRFSLLGRSFYNKWFLSVCNKTLKLNIKNRKKKKKKFYRIDYWYIINHVRSLMVKTKTITVTSNLYLSIVNYDFKSRIFNDNSDMTLCGMGRRFCDDNEQTLY